MGKSTANKTVAKAKNKVTELGEKAIKNPMSLLYLIGGSFVLYSVYKIAKFGSTVSGGSNFDSTIDVTNNLTPNANNTTITALQAKMYASQLLQAFNWEGWGFNPFPGYHKGTDTATIESIFDKINSDDFLLIYKEFGYKEYLMYGSPPDNTVGGVIVELGVSELGDLVFWLQKELDVLDFSLNSKVKNIVEQAGFAFA